GSGDTALLLVVRRVLRGVHLLVQRSIRSPGLGVLLGRRRGAGAAAAAVAPLHAGFPGAADRAANVSAIDGQGFRQRRARAPDLSTGAPAWRDARRGDRARILRRAARLAHYRRAG